MKKLNIRSLIIISIYVFFHTSVIAGNVSKYLGNNQRSGDVDVKIPSSPGLLWTYNEKHAPRPGWEEPLREVQYIDFDYVDHAASDGVNVYFGSSADHKIYAIDIKTGMEKYHFYTGGAVRFAPVIQGNKLYAVSDDGCLYCLDKKGGNLLWKFRGGPNDQKLMGNDQMASHWPARSGVLVDGDKLYFSAGMWSRDGVFIYCLDSSDGSVIWKNDTSGFHFQSMPHSYGFGGVSPQGYLLLHKGVLYIPMGRGAPAYFDAKTGKFIQYENGAGYKPHQAGGSWVMAWKDWVIFKRRLQHTEEDVRYEERHPGAGPTSGLIAYHFQTGDKEWSLTDKNLAIVRDDIFVMAGAGPVIKVNMNEILKDYPNYFDGRKNITFDTNIIIPDGEYFNTSIIRNAQNVGKKVEQKGKKKGGPIPLPGWMSPVPYKQWATDIGRVYSLLLAGNTVIAGGRDTVSGLDYESGKLLWQKEVSGDAYGICAVNGYFFVSTTKGKIYCFGKGKDTGLEVSPESILPTTKSSVKKLAGSILDMSGITEGYCLLLGAGDGELLFELISQSGLVVYCLEPDKEKVNKTRAILDKAGLLGLRGQVHVGSYDKLPYNPYIANLVVFGDTFGSGIDNLNGEELYRVLRPYGGTAVYLSEKGADSELRQWLLSAKIMSSEVIQSSRGLMIKRGPLPGAGQWTHAYGNIGRTGSSEDSIVKRPLGMLWWGGPGPARIVSRHWRAPSPLFSYGHLYIQGQHDVIGVDAYNGREMWNRHLENVGRFPPYHRGGNIVADDKSVFCIQELKCLRLDGRTGVTIKEYTFSLDDSVKQEMYKLPGDINGNLPGIKIVWEYLGVIDEYIIGTLSNIKDMETKVEPFGKGVMQSRYIFAFQKKRGTLLWTHKVERAVSPMAIVADNKAVYFIDRTPEPGREKKSKRRSAPDKEIKIESTIKAVALSGGKLLWEQDISTTKKALLLKDNYLVAIPNPAEKQAKPADKGVAVYSISKKRLLWEKEEMPGVSYYGRGTHVRNTFINGNKLYLPWVFDLETGKELLVKKNPLTGEDERFEIPGKNFCGTVAAGGNLIVYRSASLGIQELSKDSGSYWLPEVRPSCWISVLPAGGMLVAPEGYSTCICPYNYKTSLAMIPVERHEDWSIYLSQRIVKGKSSTQNKKKANKKKKGRNAAQEEVTRIKELRLNFNAHGDKMDKKGIMWMAYPRVEKKKYNDIVLPVEHEGEENSFRYNTDYYSISQTDMPWLYTSGLEGPLTFNIRLSDNKSHIYTVRFHFVETELKKAGERVFDVLIQNKKVIKNMDIKRKSKGMNDAFIRELTGIKAKGMMNIELVPLKGKNPLICALEIIEE